MESRTDAELVALTRERGDKAAFGDLVRRYQGHAYGLAYSILGDWTEAQDMTQEAFVRVYINLHAFESPQKFAPWLRRIVFSTCMMWLRAFRPGLYQSMGKPEDVSQLEQISDDKTPSPFDSAAERELSAVVLAAIDELPPKYRVPLAMFHLDGLSYEKVAEFLEVPVGTVKSLISRARKRLKPGLKPYAQEILPKVKEVFDEHKLSELAKYRIEWLAPDRLSEMALLATGTAEPRSPDGPYNGHVDPLYNIHCELEDTLDDELVARLNREDDGWGERWRLLAEGLSGKVKSFALVAYSHDMLAGHVRFFPGSVGHLRNVREEPLVAGDDDTLAIGAGCVDLEGAEDGLDKEMVTRVVRYAKQENYKRVQAVGWCNIRAYAMWSESFPVSAYEAVGFHEVARVPYVHEAFECMLEGGHGPVVQKMVQADLDAGITKDEANTIHLVEIDTSRA